MDAGRYDLEHMQTALMMWRYEKTRPGTCLR